MKKIFTLFALVLITVALSACWPAEVSVETNFNMDGSGTRTIVIDIMDDTLSEDPIPNPEDPDGDKDKGAVLNDVHVTGGILAIQTWLEENAPDFITVHDPKVDGYHRFFKMSYTFKNFDDFLDKYKTLVNLSPTISWDDFSDDELPSLKVTGTFKKSATYSESRDLLMASLDWAVDGIWNDIYDEADLAGFVEKENIWALAGVKITLGKNTFNEESYYDEELPDGDEGDMGKIVYVESETFTLKGEQIDPVMTGVTIGGGIVLLALITVGLVFIFKKRV
ncbi:MAG: hypothetical protein WC907_08515 [Acholeplasmataceae bacterium]